MSQDIKRESEDKVFIDKDWKVFIRNDAFRKMLFHILRFANNSLDENQEAMGICIGEVNTDNKSLNLTNIIPISHGDVAELGFSQEIHEQIKQIEDQISTTNFKMIGWYHSRLKGGLFFSKADKSNQLYFQNIDQPYGFGIIFDINLLNRENNFGFELFRLKEISKKVESEYLQVPYELERPNTLEVYNWVKSLVEDTQNKNPIIINEINEMKKPLPEELQEIPSAEEVKVEIVENELTEKLKPVFLGFQEGSSKFVESFIESYTKQLSNWLNDFRKASLNGTEYIRSAINQMTNTVDEGLEDVQHYFKRSFDEISKVFIANIAKYIDQRISNQKEFSQKTTELFSKISTDAKELMEKTLKEIINELKEKLSHEDVKLHEIYQMDNQIKPLLSKSSEILSKAYNNTNSLSDSLTIDIKRIGGHFNTRIVDEVENLNLNSDSIRNKYKEIEELIERLQKVISDFRQLK